jgi:hypothetical protein
MSRFGTLHGDFRLDEIEGMHFVVLAKTIGISAHGCTTPNPMLEQNLPTVALDQMGWCKNVAQCRKSEVSDRRP